jgi:hypothetical protein
MGSLLAKLAIGMVARLMTEKFLSKLLVEGMRAWSKQTPNPYDDRVTAAVADAFGVEKEALATTK